SARGGAARRRGSAARLSAPRPARAGPHDRRAVVSRGTRWPGSLAVLPGRRRDRPRRIDLCRSAPQPPHSSVRLVAVPLTAAVAVQPRLVLGVAAREGGIAVEELGEFGHVARAAVLAPADSQAQLRDLLAGDGAALPPEPGHVDVPGQVRPAR